MPRRYTLHYGKFTLEYAWIGGYCSFPDWLDPGPWGEGYREAK